jgi:hypothetical protein
MKTPFSQLNLSSIELRGVEYHVAESKNVEVLHSLKIRPLFTVSNWPFDPCGPYRLPKNDCYCLSVYYTLYV